MDKNGFINYMESKDFAKKTIVENIRCVEKFLEKIKKEDVQITKPDILHYLEYLKNIKKLQNASRKQYLSALNHYFTYLYKEEQIFTNPCAFIKIRGIRKRQMYKIYTEEELEVLFDNYYQLFVRGFDDSYMRENEQKQSKLCRERNALLLSILVNQGTTTGEIKKLELADIDLTKATLKIQGGLHGNARNLPIKATQIGLFMNYLQNIRPQIAEYYNIESDKLFLSLPAISQKKTDGGTMLWAFEILAQQLRSMDKNFLNVLQLRASVITLWLKTQGLRKTQYLAGHRYVSSTEKYQINNLDSLIDDINKMHPFL